ncbi:hypothetical protein JKP88DRAFT_350736 [Tribonema minus]|uniref:Uncharacterized protein n=1 Tax=Tribonema minus TaxID=303371 RepID=A0A835YPI9_9STRA|nr:hypothetical protein JKP88DRAFT_350736 [Tribonema minus]
MAHAHRSLASVCLQVQRKDAELRALQSRCTLLPADTDIGAAMQMEQYWPQAHRPAGVFFAEPTVQQQHELLPEHHLQQNELPPPPRQHVLPLPDQQQYQPPSFESTRQQRKHVSQDNLKQLSDQVVQLQGQRAFLRGQLEHCRELYQCAQQRVQWGQALELRVDARLQGLIQDRIVSETQASVGMQKLRRALQHEHAKNIKELKDQHAKDVQSLQNKIFTMELGHAEAVRQLEAERDKAQSDFALAEAAREKATEASKLVRDNAAAQCEAARRDASAEAHAELLDAAT